MRKDRAVLLLLVMLLLLSGCSAVFEKEYYSVEEYQGETDDTELGEEDDDLLNTTSISNYAALRRAITWLVTEHAESAELQFQNYDGSISQDISAACWEVKSSTALGAFAVDYISYDLSRIVSYYQAEIYITYKRSAYQVESLKEVSTVTALADRLDTALRENETYLVLEISSAATTVDTVEQYILEAYYADPLACPVLPDIEVGIYPESGADRIVEVTLDYGTDSDTLARMREDLGIAVDEMVTQARYGPTETEEGDEDLLEEAPVPDTDSEEDLGEDLEEEDVSGEVPEEQEPVDILYALCQYLASHCEVTEEAGSTAWDALVEGYASSEGVALAMEAGCLALDIPCQIVVGRVNGEDHVWNIVTLDDASYHVDVANWDLGPELVFLMSDAEIWGGYWWDTSEYPICLEGYGYFDIEDAEASGELDASGEIEASETDAIIEADEMQTI